MADFFRCPYIDWARKTDHQAEQAQHMAKLETTASRRGCLTATIHRAHLLPERRAQLRLPALFAVSVLFTRTTTTLSRAPHDFHGHLIHPHSGLDGSNNQCRNRPICSSLIFQPFIMFDSYFSLLRFWYTRRRTEVNCSPTYAVDCTV